MRDHALMLQLILPAVMLMAGCAVPEPIPAPSAPSVQPASGLAAPTPVGDFAGSPSCADCHVQVQAQWADSHHAHAWTPPAAGDPTEAALDGHSVVGWLGWEPLRQPLIEVGQGRIQAWERAWDPVKSEWFDVFSDRREPGDRGHWTGPAMTWNSQCAPCHTTDLEVGYRPSQDTYETRVGEQGVGCEACHGASGAHAAGAGAPPMGEPGMDVCAACHSRRADRSPRPQPTGDFLARYAPQLVDRTDAFYADGQIRDEDFEYNAFLGSRMYDEGVVCTDCHDPHSGELVRTGDALCLECHQTHEGWAIHDHHGGAVACVDCHMPQTTYMQRHPRRDHGFHLPDPLLAAEIGAPDTCTRACHSDRDPAWAGAALTAWGVDPAKRPHRARARAVAAARGIAPDGYTLALRMLESDPHPTWRAVAGGLLVPWAGVPSVEQSLRKAARDPSALVRFAVSGGGDAGSRRAYLSAHRDQPDAAVEYGDLLDRDGDRAGLAELRRAYKLWPRESIAAHALAIALSRHGQAPEALAVLEQAVLARPDDPGLWDALGRARAGTGDVAGGIAALRETVSRDGSRSRSWYNLGILLDSAGDPTGALTAWERASATDPLDPDPSWARASLLFRQGDLAGARGANTEALRRAPNHPGAAALQSQLDAESR